MAFTVPTDEELKERLTPEEYDVLRKGGTEIPYTGDFLVRTPDGVFVCKVCGNPLFGTNAHFNSMMGWPAFDTAIDGSVEETAETAAGISRIEVRCAQCKSHLGIKYETGPTPANRHYCINSVSIRLDESQTPPEREVYAPTPNTDE